ncbi:MAG: RagB/SusD family nutrient uptake outer membrane protein [Prevotellaceae bacterium]|jgi:hypothetical protein|nr:RagB/SusD family nutrient uptake outer membrane protein [Prevotellaceae bacterium]
MQKKSLYVIMVLMLALAACSDWLDLKPYDGVVEDDYWKTKEDVHSMVVGCYSSLLNKTMVSSFIYWGEARADMIASTAASSSALMYIIRGEITPENTIVKWDEFYTTINQCSKVIEKAGLVKELDQTFDDKLCRQYVAEATVIRSLMYFYLVRSFRDVPLVLKASDDDTQDYYYAKTNGEAILDTLTIHLEKVLGDLPIAYDNNDQSKGRITCWAAMALLADIYLWQGSYERCSELCKQIIGSGQFSLIPVSREMVPVLDNTGLTIDTVYYANTADADYLFDQLYVVGNCVESIFELQFPKQHESLGDPFYDLFNTSRPKIASNDLVLDEVIFPEDERDKEAKDVRGSGFAYNNGYVWKYVGTSRSGNTMRIERMFPHWIVYRYADVILMQAEALNQLAMRSNPNDMATLKDAYSLVRQIRERANAVENSDSELGDVINGKALEKLILDERAREFAFEGKRWYDVLRFARRDSYGYNETEQEYANREYLMQLAINSAPPEKLANLQVKYTDSWFHYWPIYVSTVEVNKNLLQNEFYLQQ